MAGMELKRGAKVEISSQEEGFQGSYYSATVIARVGKNMFLIEYDTLCTEHDETKLLRDIVDESLVRPSPPEIQVSDFSVHDKVDAYANDGWWVGRISDIVDSSKYLVYFKGTGDECTYPFSKLRVHQEFVNGKWVVSSYKKGLKCN